MEGQIVKILETTYLTHDVKRFIVEKPVGLNFKPGQAVYLSVNSPGWEDKVRPFTFTSLNDWPYLEFIIKIYEDRHEVTAQLARTNAGATLLLHDVFGTITYKGPGVFIAGGAGVTPFISILRDLYNKEDLHGDKLILSNKTAADIILRNEFAYMLGRNFINIFTRQGVIGYAERRISKNLLIDLIHDFSQHFYLCGPSEFVEEIKTHLLSLGADAESIIFEN
ncbi:MAG: FAD-binding oxidoreductase [Ginsengibacter sp.]